ncbi:unnamed protein product [Mytilus coruscus]|uniref:Uncharacterized protein n=1 Tax=Mytilus coruscus TaxID=42192 RepID=A0A6J8E526_MYTCO|nr:unnamed protein product [Mytilus coruscus]
MNFDNKEYDNMQDIVNHFNTRFTTIGDKYVTNNTQFQANKLNDYVQDKIPAGVKFKIPFIKLDETKKLLSKLETSKATGLDEVGPFFIKLSSEALAPSIRTTHCGYSEAQSGKSICDAKIAHMRIYISSGRNITSPYEMQASIMDGTGVKACHCAVVEVDTTKQTMTSHQRNQSD